MNKLPTKTIAIFGEVIIDHKRFGRGHQLIAPGGPPIFIANTLNKQNARIIIVAHHSHEFPKPWIPHHAKLIPNKALLERNPTYYLTYEGSKRTLSVNSPEAFKPVLPSLLTRSETTPVHHVDLAFFASTLPTQSARFIKIWQEFSKIKISVLLAQGLLRRPKPNGTIVKQRPDIVLPLLDQSIDRLSALFLSSEDHTKTVIKTIVDRFKNRTLIAVTQGIKGVSITYQGKTNNIPTTWPIPGIIRGRALDTTGAGDCWAASFSYEYFIRHLSPEQAARIAHKSTARYIKKTNRLS